MADPIDYFSVVLDWPVVVGGTVAYVFWRFGDNIGGLIDRVSKVRSRGVEVTIRSQQEVPSGDDADEISDEELWGPIIEEYERAIAEAGEGLQETQRDLAFARIELEFERLHRVMFQSQIDALRELAGVAPRGVEPARLYRYQQAAKEAWGEPAEYPGPEAWAAFLTGQALMEPRTDGRFYITEKGTAFVYYVNQYDMPERPW